MFCFNLSAELDSALMHHQEVVLAGFSAEQKLTIVESCQRLGAVVAVTGIYYSSLINAVKISLIGQSKRSHIVNPCRFPYASLPYYY